MRKILKILLITIIILGLAGCNNNQTSTKKEELDNEEQMINPSVFKEDTPQFNYKMAELNTYKDDNNLNHMWLAIELNTKGYSLDTEKLKMTNNKKEMSGSAKDNGYNIMVYEGFICEDESHNTNPKVNETLYDYDRCIYTIKIITPNKIDKKNIAASLSVLYDGKEVNEIKATCNAKPNELTLKHKYIHSNIPFEVNGNYYIQDSSLVGTGEYYKKWQVTPIKGTLEDLSKALKNNKTKFITADKEIPSTYMKNELTPPEGWEFCADIDNLNDNTLDIGWKKEGESLDLDTTSKLYKSVLEYTDDDGTMIFVF